jgi:hypothetical protein
MRSPRGRPDGEYDLPRPPPRRQAVATFLLARTANASSTRASAARSQTLLAFGRDFCSSRAADDIGEPLHRRVVPGSCDEAAGTLGRAPDRSRGLSRTQE